MRSSLLISLLICPLALAGCERVQAQGTCGDGVETVDEECDDGNEVSGDGCSAVCEIETDPAVCGDGNVDEGEECDDGNTTAGDGCDGTCHDEPEPACGDGTVDADEECDDGNVSGGDGCSGDCRLENPVCGDGFTSPDLGEECDDGNLDPGDGCDPECHYYVCGNGTFQPPTEECDDGNLDDFDGCSSTCLYENGTCTAARSLGCGSTHTWNTANADSTDQVSLYPNCYGLTDFTGREYVYSFTSGIDRLVFVQLTTVVPELNAVLLGASCEAATCMGGTATELQFWAAAGETYHLVVDGMFGAEGAYTIASTCPVCGNGIVEGFEICDDGDLNNGDGCDSNCTPEVCGNGVIQTGEQCDDGNLISGDGCSSTCVFEGEACPSTGAAIPALGCGSVVSGTNDMMGSTDTLDLYSCTSWQETGPEVFYTFTSSVPRTVTVSLAGVIADLDVMVMQAPCNTMNCVAAGNDTAVFSAIAGVTYTFAVDGYFDAVGPYTLSVTCAP